MPNPGYTPSLLSYTSPPLPPLSYIPSELCYKPPPSLSYTPSILSYTLPPSSLSYTLSILSYTPPSSLSYNTSPPLIVS